MSGWQGSNFGQTTSGFGQQQQPQQNQGWGASSMNQPQNQSGFSRFGAYQQQPTTQTQGYGQQPQQQQQQSQSSLQMFYRQVQQFITPSTTSHGMPFQVRQENIADKSQASQMANFYNIRIEPQFGIHSQQMLKVLDLMAMKMNGPQPSYETMAANEFQQNMNNYVHIAKIQGTGPQLQMQQQPGAFSGFQQQQQTQSGWGAQSQQPKPLLGTPQGQTSSGFGQTSTFGSAGGATMFGQTQGAFGQQKPAFGMGAQQTQPQFGQASSGIKPYGATTTTTPAFGGGQGPSLFGGQPQQPTLFNQPSQPAFGTQPQPGASMFNATPIGQQQSTTTPLFGGAPASGSTLFGGAQTQQQSSLFGGPGGGLSLGASGQQTGLPLSTQPAQQTQSLFGGAPKLTTQPSQGGLFGAQTQPGGGGSSLFGATASTAGGSLFGGGASATTQQTTSLFGAKPLTSQTSTQSAGGSLFGAQGGTSLFGGGASTTTQPSLFGAVSQPATIGQQPAQGTMFSLTGQPTTAQGAQAQPTPGINPYGDINKLTDPYADQKQYLSAASPFDNADDELKKLQEEIYKGKPKEDSYSSITPLDRLKLGLSSIQTPTDEEYLTPFEPGTNLNPSQDEKNAALYDKLVAKYQAKQLNERLLGDNRNDKVFSLSKGFSNAQRFEPGLYSKKSFGTDSSFTISRQNSSQVSEQQQQYLQSSPSDKKVFRPNNTNQREVESVIQPPAPIPVNPDVVQIQVTIPENGNHCMLKTSFNIHKSRTVKDLYNKVRAILVQEKRAENEIQSYKLLYKNAILNETLSLQSAGIEKTASITVIFELNEPIQRRAPEHLVPRPPKEKYQTIPSYDALRKMSLDELQAVRNFTVMNEYGKIQFEGATDVTEVDLADIVTIDKNSVEVYDDERHQNIKPQVGFKLNKPAIITLNRIALGNKSKYKNTEDKIAFLKKAAQQMGGQHLSYDPNTFIWQFQVFHFTKYKFLDEDESEAQGAQVPQPIPQQVNLQQIVETEFKPRPQLFQDTSVLQQTPFQPPMMQAPLQQQYQMQLQSLPLNDPFRINTTNTAFQKPFVQETLPIQQTTSKKRRIGLPLEDQEDLISVQSESMRQQIIPEEEMEIELPSKRGPIPQVEVVQKRFIPEKMTEEQRRLEKIKLKREQIQNNIRKREEELAQTSQLYAPKKTLEQSLNYFKSIGVEIKTNQQGKISGFKNVPLKGVPRFRPQFRPDGSLLTLNQNKLQIREVGIVPQTKNSDQKATYQDLKSVFLSHMKLEQNPGNIAIQQQMNRMDIGAQAVDQVSLQGLARRQVGFDDKSIEEALSKDNLPYTTFKSNPKDLFFFYEDLAKYLLSKLSQNRNLSQIAKDKLTHEFYVISLLNALFGNPNINLVQLHPDFKGGLNTYQKSKDKFAGNFEDANTMEIGKKRRNALTEVIRFINMQENKVLEQDTYKRAIKLLLNGDLKGAVQWLNSKNKAQMANHVISCFSATSEMSKVCLRRLVEQRQGIFANLSPGAREMVDFLTGDYYKTEGKVLETKWMQALGYYLMVKEKSDAKLTEIIEAFSRDLIGDQASNQKFKVNSLLWIIIKFYGLNSSNPDILHNQLLTYQDISIYDKEPQKLSQDHRLQFILTLNFYYLTNFHYAQNAALYQQQYKKNFVSDERFTHFTMLYLNQLMRENDWQQALLIQSFIPPSFRKLRKMIVFKILQSKAMSLMPTVDEQTRNQNQNWVHNVVKIPQDLVSISRAMLLQSQGHYERALEEWQRASNMNQVHQIFLKKIVPLYFSPQTLGSKDQVLNIRFNREQLDLIKRQLDFFKGSEEQISDWKSQGSLILSFYYVLLDINQRGEMQQQQISLLEGKIQRAAKDLISVRDSQNAPLSLQIIQRFIWETLVHIFKDLKLRKFALEEKDHRYIYFEKIQELFSVYPDSPQLQRIYDELSLNISTKVYCSQAHRYQQQMFVNQQQRQMQMMEEA